MRTLKYLHLLAIIAAAVLVMNVPTNAQSVLTQMREAFEKEQAGDLDGAIQVYQQITANTELNQRYIARASYRMGMCYLKKGDKDKAKKQFEDLVSKFPRKLAAVANARRELKKIWRQERSEEAKKIRYGIQEQKQRTNILVSSKGPPAVTHTTPANFADNVPPTLQTISVTFNQQMMDNSCSWTRFDENTFPRTLGQPQYDRTRKTCKLRVKLKPATVYFVGINCGTDKNFKSSSGESAKPYALTFATRDSEGKPTRIPEEVLARAKAINSATKTSGELVKPESGIPGRELSNDEGYNKDNTRFITVNGPAVLFEAPTQDSYLKAVRIHGLRYDPKPTKKDFHIRLCDGNFKTIADFPFPYTRFKLGVPEWVTLKVNPTKLPAKFTICLTSQKALAVSCDTKSSGNSFFGSPGEKMTPFNEGDWLIRAIINESAGGAGKEIKSADTSFVIKPLGGIGKVRFGMTIEQAKQILGEPQRMTGRACEYLNSGFAIVPERDGTVAAIMCGDASVPDSPLIKNCKCRTDKGIGMGSSRQDVVSAYGQPSSAQQFPGIDGLVMLRYDKLNANFLLRDNKVVAMAFSKTRSPSTR